MSDISVLKFGSSVLTSLSDYPKLVHEVYRELRRGRRVCVVVSAYGSTTDHLHEFAHGLSGTPNRRAYAALLATGEAHSVSAFALALDGAGIPQLALQSHQIALKTRGCRTDAEPESLNLAPIKQGLERGDCVVVPGFVGTDHEGFPTLLGRGGSDLTALHLAHLLGAKSCRLVKDVAGWYEHDPALDGPSPRRYQNLNWNDAIRSQAPIVQPKAVLYARRLDREFELGAPGSRELSCVSRRATTFAATSTPPSKLAVSLLGFGNVGAEVFRQLADNPGYFEVKDILVRDKNKERALPVPKSLLKGAGEFRLDPSHLIIETLGGTDHALKLVSAALRSGASVVSANKALIQKHGLALKRTARAHGGQLRYSAAVGGAVPMLETVRACRAEASIQFVEGILNGTCNFILDALTEGADLETALRRAQDIGLAEADPSLDLDGSDVAHKLILLAREAFQEELDFSRIPRIDLRNKISQIDPSGGVPRLIGRIFRERGKLRSELRLRQVDPDSPWAKVLGQGNALLVSDHAGRQKWVHGKGAGGRPTSQSVMADVWDLVRREQPFPKAEELFN